MTFKETIEALKENSFIELKGYPTLGEKKAVREGYCHPEVYKQGLGKPYKYCITRSDEFEYLVNRAGL